MNQNLIRLKDQYKDKLPTYRRNMDEIISYINHSLNVIAVNQSNPLCKLMIEQTKKNCINAFNNLSIDSLSVNVYEIIKDNLSESYYTDYYQYYSI